MKRRANNEGSIYFSESEGYWIAEITLSNGKRKKKRSKRQQVVKDWMLEQRAAVHGGLITPDERMLLAHFFDRFIEDVAQHSVKPKTLSTYKWILSTHVKPEIGRIKLSSLKPHHLQTLYRKKIEDGLSKKTVLHIHGVIRRSLNEAVKWGLIQNNPCNQVTPPKPEKKIPNVWTAIQAKTFLNAVKDHDYYPIYLIALTTGARQGEILGMEWGNLDLDSGTISISRTIQDINGHTVVGDPKTSLSRRKLNLPKVTLDALKGRREETGFIFKTSVGTPISPRNLLRHFYKVLDETELPRIRFHDLRHTFATLMLTVDGGVHPKIVQEMLGHRSIIQTLDTYSHVVPGMSKEATKKMDKIFLP